MTSKTPEESWTFWAPIICNADGSINVDQVKKELHDFLFVIENVPKVYDHITGGRVSKILTDPQCVIDEAEENYRRCFEGVTDSTDRRTTPGEVDDLTQK